MLLLVCPWKAFADVDYRKTTSGDIVSMLLNIYDTKEVFVKELQVILAERLLSSKDYEVEREVYQPLLLLITRLVTSK